MTNSRELGEQQLGIFFKTNDGIRGGQEFRGLGNVYKRQDIMLNTKFGKCIRF